MDRNMTIPTKGAKAQETDIVVDEVKVQEQEPVEVKEETKEQQPTLSKEESEYIEKVFFEEDETVRLRDGISYKIPPLGLRDAKTLMKKLNSVDTGVIIANLIANDKDEDNYDALLEVLYMAFKPYYKDMTVEYLGDFVDLNSAKQIIDIMIGLNGLKKSL